MNGIAARWDAHDIMRVMYPFGSEVCAFSYLRLFDNMVPCIVFSGITQMIFECMKCVKA